jgi:hypothetical protein
MSSFAVAPPPKRLWRAGGFAAQDDNIVDEDARDISRAHLY